jgi:hypothetical protein
MNMLHPPRGLLVFCLLFGLLQQCALTPTNTAGTGVETGNTTIVGRAITQAGGTYHVEIDLVADLWAKDTTALFSASRGVNDSGYYSIDSLPAGRYRITGREIGGIGAFTRTVFVDGNRDTIFIGVDSLLHSSKITGKVLVFDGRNPSGISVGLRGTKTMQTIAADGRFIFNNVAPGEQVLFAESSTLNSGIPQLMTISVPPDTVIDTLFFIPQQKNMALDILPGQTWGYLGLTPGVENASYFDAYAFKSTTLIYNRFTYVFDNKQYQVDGFTRCLSVSSKNFFISISGDSVMVLEQEIGLIPGLLKRKGSSRITQDNIQYDTIRFKDLTVPIIFSSKLNQTWYYRQPGDPRGNLPVIRRYTGNEIVQVPGGTFNCLRMEWEWDSTGGLGSTPVKAVDYIADLGCVKKDIKSVYYDSSGRIDSLSKALEISYCGSDTTQYTHYFPPISQSLFDSISAIVGLHWSPNRFIAWMKGLDMAGSGDYLSDSIHSDLNIYYSAFGLFAICSGRNVLFDSSAGLPVNLNTLELINRISGFQGIDSLSDVIANREYLIMMLISPEAGRALAQGWDDCDWNWSSQGIINKNDKEAPCGKSPTMQALMQRVAGLYYYPIKPIPNIP